jgi:hypothetical protein
MALPGFLEGAVLGQIQQVKAGVCHRKKVRILPQRHIIKYLSTNLACSTKLGSSSIILTNKRKG